MSTPVVVSVAPGYRMFRAARNIALVDGAIIVGLCAWGGLDWLLNGRHK